MLHLTSRGKCDYSWSMLCSLTGDQPQEMSTVLMTDMQYSPGQMANKAINPVWILPDKNPGRCVLQCKRKMKTHLVLSNIIVIMSNNIHSGSKGISSSPFSFQWQVKMCTACGNVSRNHGEKCAHTRM